MSPVTAALCASDPLFGWHRIPAVWNKGHKVGLVTRAPGSLAEGAKLLPALGHGAALGLLLTSPQQRLGPEGGEVVRATFSSASNVYNPGTKPQIEMGNNIANLKRGEREQHSDLRA